MRNKRITYRKRPSDVLFALFVVNLIPLAAEELRSFDQLFPNLNPEIKTQAFADGYRGYDTTLENLKIKTAADSGIDIARFVRQEPCKYIIEDLIVVPYANGKPLDKLFLYNSIQDVKRLEGIEYPSHTRKRRVALYSEAVRISAHGSERVLPNPPPQTAIPDTETLFVRLRDVNFGNTFFRNTFYNTPRGFIYTVTNDQAVFAVFIPAIRKDKFIAGIYVEPLAEGTLVYCLCSIDVPDFVDRLVSIPSAIQKRLDVIVTWFVQGLH